jgi:hypothetical protein
VCRTSVLSWLTALALSLTSACTDDSTGPALVPECTGPLSISVATSPEVSFSWSPDCRLTGWNIEPVGLGNDMWLVLWEGGNEITPPVTYGVVPAGAREIHPAEVLVSGTEYNLILFKWTGPGLQDGEILDTIHFTP